VLWSGDGTTTGVYITGVGFQPDLVWAKQRNGTGYHITTDVLRGNQQFLFTNATDAEFTSLKRIEDFQADGFNAEDDFYQSGQTYVSWNWKANGSGVSNTDGSITSTVSANTDAGFSIVSYTIDSQTTPSIGHGLNSAPELILVKGRNQAYNWDVYHKDMVTSPESYRLILNSTAGVASSPAWGYTAPTSSVFYTTGGGSWYSSGNTMIAYCFHSVEGFSKFGSYTGNGSTDGPFVYTGFRPAFVMTKRTDSTSSWYIVDQERSANINLMDDYLRPDSSNAEVTGSTSVAFDFNSNGFKIREDGGSNQSGGTYIYMAFAENPFKYANAR
jgi:hypothetical protein